MCILCVFSFNSFTEVITLLQYAMHTDIVSEVCIPWLGPKYTLLDYKLPSVNKLLLVEQRPTRAIIILLESMVDLTIL